MTSQRDDEVLVIFTPFQGLRRTLNAPEGIRNLHIFRPKLIAYINLSKVLDNYMNLSKVLDNYMIITSVFL